MEKNREKRAYVAPRIEKIEFDDMNVILTSSGSGNNGDVGRGKGQGGGCDGEPGHPNQRTFSNGKNSGC